MVHELLVILRQSIRILEHDLPNLGSSFRWFDRTNLHITKRAIGSERASVNSLPSRDFRKKRALTTLAFVAIATLIVAGIAGSAAYVAMILPHNSSDQTGSTITYTSFTIGSANFSSAWHYVGNVTLSGSESSCEIMRLPCPSNPQNTAEELTSMNGTVAYVETIHGCGPDNCTTTTIVLVNNSLYCVSPKDNIATQTLCPRLIT